MARSRYQRDFSSAEASTDKKRQRTLNLPKLNMEETLKWAQRLQLYLQVTDEVQESEDCTHCVDGALYRRESF